MHPLRRLRAHVRRGAGGRCDRLRQPRPPNFLQLASLRLVGKQSQALASGIDVGIDQQFQMQINYGVNKVRFMNPVKTGARIRARYLLLDVTDVPGGWQTRFQVTVEMEGVEKPACVDPAGYRTCVAAHEEAVAKGLAIVRIRSPTTAMRSTAPRAPSISEEATSARGSWIAPARSCGR